MSFQFLYSGFILLLIICAGCRKDEHEWLGESYNPQTPAEPEPMDDALHPFLFDNSSYWIYSNSDSIEDSVFVSKTFTDPYLDESIGLHWQSYTIHYDHSLNDKTWFEGLFKGRIGRAGINGGYTFLTHDPAWNIESIERNKSIVVGSALYSNVTKVQINKDKYFEQNAFFYYLENVGVVRKDFCDSEWNITETWIYVRGQQSLYQIQ